MAVESCCGEKHSDNLERCRKTPQKSLTFKSGYTKLTLVSNNSLLNGGKPMTLDKTAVGKTVTITQVGGSGPLRCRLLDMGLIPKTKVTVQKVAPMGDPIELQLRGYRLSIRKEDAKNIEVSSGEEAL